MSRLTTLASPLRTLSPNIVAASDRTTDQQRSDRAPWRKWYSLARWRRLRLEVIYDAVLKCAKCGKTEFNPSLLVADHIAPHRGNPTLFWDRTNLQCLCAACHSGEKQREEQSMLPGNWA